MNKEQEKIIIETLYPLIKEKVKSQLDITSPIFSVSAISGDQFQDMGELERPEDCVYISDGEKYLAIPIKDYSLSNVSLLIDILALKQYLLS